MRFTLGVWGALDGVVVHGDRSAGARVRTRERFRVPVIAVARRVEDNGPVE